MRFAVCFFTMVSVCFAQDVIFDIPAQTQTITVGDTATPFNIRGSLKKKPVAPVASIVGSIAQGSTLSGNVTWTATIQNVAPPVTFTIDGALPWVEATAPYEYGGASPGLDTKKLSNGSHVFKVTAGTASHQVTATVSNTITPPPTSFISLASYANGSDAVDDTFRIRDAGLAAKAQGKALYVPPGQWRHNALIDFDSIEVFGDGDASEFVATNPLASAIRLRGTSPKIRNIKHTVLLGSISRQFTGDQCNISAWMCNGFTIENCTINGAGQTGILCFGSKGAPGAYCKIIGNRVSNSLADGIHHHYGSQWVEIANNTVTNVGDDFISVVSYFREPIQRNFYIHDNRVVYNWQGRGITVVGGEDVQIDRNYIERSDVAGLYIWAENIYVADASYQCWNCKNITCTDNTIVNATNDANETQPAIYLGGRPGYLVENITFKNTKVINPRRDGAGVYKDCKNIQFIGTTFEGLPAGYKQYVIDPSVAAQVFITQ